MAWYWSNIGRLDPQGSPVLVPAFPIEPASVGSWSAVELPNGSVAQLKLVEKEPEIGEMWETPDVRSEPHPISAPHPNEDPA